jgi:phosphoserine phosphatase RsbU/P
MPLESRRRQREDLLVASAIRLNQALERKPILLAIRDLSLEAFDAEACSILLVNRRTDQLDFNLAHNELTDPSTTSSLAPGEGLAGWVVQQNEAALVNSAATDERILQPPDDPSSHFPITSVIAVPMVHASIVIGVVEIVNARGEAGFTETDLALLMAIGSQAAVALANARLYEIVIREKRENQLLFKLGLELARTLRLEDLLPLLVGLLSELIEFNAVGIYLYHQGSEILEWFYGHGYPEGSEEMVRLKVGEGAVGWVAEHLEALVISDVKTDDRYLCARPQTTSEVVVPLMTESELVGVFNLESDHRDGFSDRDLRLLGAFGNQAAIAIQRVWYHDEAIEKRRLEEEIRIARRIQRRLLPTEKPVVPGFDVAAFNIPSLEVSGDAYDFVDITDDQFGVMIGDVSGKGIPAGILMASFRASLRAEIRNNYAIGTILSKVNRLMWESSEDTAFVTAVYCVLNTSTGRLTFSNAGHNPVLLLRADGRECWLDEGGMLLGVFPKVQYNESHIDLADGDMLVFYTDGITEATSATDEMFGPQRLLEVAREREVGETSHAICRRLLTAVYSHCQGTHVADDLTAIVIQKVATSGLK